MVILIDPTDPKLFMLMKAISDSGYDNIEDEHDMLMEMLAQQGRTIRIEYTSEEDIHISFPKKKKLGIF